MSARSRWTGLASVVVIGMLVVVPALGALQAKSKRAKSAAERSEDPYSEMVWPKPPAKPRIKLEAVIASRADVETKSKFKRALMSSNLGDFDRLKRPHAVAYDGKGRVLVTDSQLGFVARFDRSGQRMDVLGVTSKPRLRTPLGLDVGPDGRIYVADSSHRAVLVFEEDGTLVRKIGGAELLRQPTDVLVSPDGAFAYVADSRGQQIVVFDLEDDTVALQFGHGGEGPLEFNHPTSLAFDLDGNLAIVDQLNCRIQIVTPAGEYIDEFGTRGDSWGQFVRPKDVAVDSRGLFYVTDFAFNNVQLFDIDFRLLLFLGAGGSRPGTFNGASGVAVYKDEFAVVDQLGHRLQIFRLLDASPDAQNATSE